ncbi:hypothetical protein [Tumebacillus lipolyticus]|uniref:Tc toxin complex TcA C-terminal TcB-binding domain-containing protein n=1 Tax=Tumebacillus lipolyticus TaxID=1280370 RepID=A0ABW5A1T4_9BACL
MGEGAAQVLLSQKRESLLSVDIEGKLILLSTEDVLKLGKGSEIGADQSAYSSLAIYAEQVSLYGTFSLRTGILAAHRIDAGKPLGLISTAGADGSESDGPNLDPTVKGARGGDGEAGGDLFLYAETVSTERPFLAVDATGGKGGDGQEGSSIPSDKEHEEMFTSAGDGGNGGDGGQVVALVVHPYNRLTEELVTIYHKQDLVVQKADLRALLSQFPQAEAVKSVKAKLEAAAMIVDQAEFGESLRTAGSLLLDLADAWQLEARHNLYTLGGAYGTHGSGRVRPGTNGISGMDGEHALVLEGSPELLVGWKWEQFLFVHPHQCAMLLEKAKLMYLTLNPRVTESVQDVWTLFKRLQERTAPFVNLQPDHLLFKHYQEVESAFGAYNSVAQLACIHQQASHYLTRLNLGQDAFGYDRQYAPLASYTLYEGILNRMIDDFEKLEAVYQQYYDRLDQAVQLRDYLDHARSYGESIIAQAGANVEDLRKLISASAGVIQRYEIALPDKKEALLEAIDRLERQIEDRINLENFAIREIFSALSMIAFAPEAPLIYLGEGALVLYSQYSNLKEEKVETRYLIKSIRAIKDSFGSLVEGYKVQLDGMLAPDDPGANKLIASARDLDRLLDSISSQLPERAGEEFKAIVDDYVQTIVARNNEILTYNAIVSLLFQNRDQVEQAKLSIADLNRQALANLKGTSLNLTAFLSHLYYAARNQVLEMLSLTANAFRFWAVTDQSPLQTLIEWSTPPDINAAVLRAAHSELLKRFTEAVERFANNPSRYPDPSVPHYDPKVDRGILVKLSAWQLSRFRRSGRAVIQIETALKETLKRENPFAGRANVRVEKVRAWIHGAKTEDDLLHVKITHTGEEEITDLQGDLYRFKHKPRNADFVYQISDRRVKTDGQMGVSVQLGGGGSDQTRAVSYALVGPFTFWQIEVAEENNAGRDISQVTDIELEFFISYYPFD